LLADEGQNTCPYCRHILFPAQRNLNERDTIIAAHRNNPNVPRIPYRYLGAFGDVLLSNNELNDEFLADLLRGEFALYGQLQRKGNRLPEVPSEKALFD